VGEAPFPIFRVGYADHTSWDMVWLRIDWNGAGFDAFVTDANLARTRVSFDCPQSLSPRFGPIWPLPGMRPAGWSSMSMASSPLARTPSQSSTPALISSAPQAAWSRPSGPEPLQLLRGGDYDDLAIFDHALSADAIADLAHGSAPELIRTSSTLTAEAVDKAWRFRYGWNRKTDAPPLLAAPQTRIRKVEFTDAMDLKERMWKATGRRCRDHLAGGL